MQAKLAISVGLRNERMQNWTSSGKAEKEFRFGSAMRDLIFSGKLENFLGKMRKWRLVKVGILWGKSG